MSNDLTKVSECSTSTQSKSIDDNIDSFKAPKPKNIN